MTKTRRTFTPAEKVLYLKRHLLESVPISTLCDEAAISPTLFYHWQQQFFERGAAAFESPRSEAKAEARHQSRIEKLEARLRKKDEVIAIVTEEHLQLKKDLGEI